MEKDIENIFMNLINKHYKDVKPVPIKKQVFLGKTSFEEIFTSIILNKVKKDGYYK